MVCFEISRSNGHGTLVSHELVYLHDGEQVAIDNDNAVQMLDETEAAQFQAMHGGNVAT